MNAVKTESEMYAERIHAVFYNVCKCIERFWTFISITCATILARFRVCCQFYFTVSV
jgi:hypothetical protein